MSKQKNLTPATAGLPTKPMLLLGLIICIDGVFAPFFFFFLDEKETKNQERLIARQRTRSALRTWAATLRATLAVG